MAESYADGLQFLDNRKSILSDSLGKAFENLENETDATYLKALFPGDQNNYIIHLGFNKKNKFWRFNSTKMRLSSLLTAPLQQALQFLPKVRMKFCNLLQVEHYLFPPLE